MVENISKLLIEYKKKQLEIKEKIKLIKPDFSINLIAGCDSAFLLDTIISIFVIFEYPSLKEIEVQYNFSKVDFPYIPGFLSFRELPNILETFKKVKNKPDIIMVDGSGIMHPRRTGIASHLGVTLNIPTIGVAKHKLYGKYELPEETKGSYTNVYDKDEIIAIALRSKDKVKPIFISPGHLCDFDTALNLTLATLRKHKLPEPTRIADKYSKDFKSKA